MLRFVLTMLVTLLVVACTPTFDDRMDENLAHCDAIIAILEATTPDQKKARDALWSYIEAHREDIETSRKDGSKIFKEDMSPTDRLHHGARVKEELWSRVAQIELLAATFPEPERILTMIYELKR